MNVVKFYLTMVSLVALLVSNALAAAWTGSTSEPENMKKIDGEAFYVITTADELAWFAEQVNGGNSTINAVLGNDIVFGKDENSVSTVNWTPIGKSTSRKFQGILDGAGYTIFGMYTSGFQLAGLVGVLNTEGVVRNLKTRMGKVSGKYRGGGIVAHNDGLVQNVNNGNDIVISYSSTNKDSTVIYVGGVAGHNGATGKIIDCLNKASVNETAPESRAGGIAGQNSGVIEKCTNNGIVDAKTLYAGLKNADKHKVYSGGIVGYNEGSVNKCNNNKSVSAKGYYSYTSSELTATPSGSQYVTSTKYIYSESYSGGISGFSTTTILNCSNFADVTNFNSTDNKGFLNGIIASGNAKNSIDVKSLKYWLNGTEIQGAAENMQKDQFAWILNTTNGTEENSGVWTRGTDGYPTFANEDSLAIRKVVFNDDGVTSNRYTNYKGNVVFPEDPEPAEGYIFSGWYNADEVKVKPATVFVADQTVNAAYIDASNLFWTINFFNTDSQNSLLETKQYQHGSVVAYGGSTPTKASTMQYSYTFKGWDVEPTNAVEDFDYHAVYDSTLRSYKITFNNYDGSKIENGTFEYGTTPSCSKTPTRTSTVEWTYSHKGWRPAIDVVTGDAAYTAIYDSAKVKYKVTFMNGTAVINEQMVAYGDAAIAPTNVVREGYKFVGWNTSYAKVTEELVVKALFEELIIRKISVIDESGKNIENTEVGDGEKYILPEAPAKEGYSFDGWYNGNTKLGIAGDEITVIADITITAKYTVKSFVIVFVNESDTLQKTSVKYGETPVYTGKTPTKPSTAQYTYTFANWTPSITTVKGDATYKATFIGVLNLYKVTFLDFDGSVLKSQEVKYGSAATAPIEPQRDGYKFLGWDKNFDKVVSNLEVTALFEKNSSSSSTMSSSSEVVSSSSREESSSSDGGEALEFAPIIPQFSVQVFARNVQIAGAKTGSYYAVFDMQGRVIVASQKVVAANFNFALPQSGNYLIKIGSQVRKINVK